VVASLLQRLDLAIFLNNLLILFVVFANQMTPRKKSIKALAPIANELPIIAKLRIYTNFQL